MKGMQASDLRERSNEDLSKQLDDLEAELFNLRFQHTTGQLDNPIRLRDVRRDIARVKTVQRERQLQGGSSDGQGARP